MLAGSDFLRQRWLMALATGGSVKHDGLLPGGKHTMGIVAVEAGHRTLTLEETARFAQTIGCADNLKAVVVSLALGVVEVTIEIFEGLAGNIGEGVAVKFGNDGRQMPAGGARGGIACTPQAGDSARVSRG